MESDEAIIDGICEYADKYQIKALLQEYMKRVVLERPKDPLRFLIKTITENPYTPPPPQDPSAVPAAPTESAAPVVEES